MPVNEALDPSDPNRCQATYAEGQCSKLALPGRKFCRQHSGGAAPHDQEKQAYLLSRAEYSKRLAELEAHQEPVRELQRAIALTHMLIERRLDACKTDQELMAACGPLNQLVLTMERLVKSAVQIERDLGALLSKTAVLNLAQQLVQVLIEELRDIPDYEHVVDRVIGRLFNTITVTTNSEQKSLEN